MPGLAPTRKDHREVVNQRNHAQMRQEKENTDKPETFRPLSGGTELEQDNHNRHEKQSGEENIPSEYHAPLSLALRKCMDP